MNFITRSVVISLSELDSITLNFSEKLSSSSLCLCTIITPFLFSISKFETKLIIRISEGSEI